MHNGAVLFFVFYSIPCIMECATALGLFPAHTLWNASESMVVQEPLQTPDADADFPHNGPSQAFAMESDST